MKIVITGYNAICNAGNNIDEIYQKAVNGDNTNFDISDNYIKEHITRVGAIHSELPEISEENFNIRANRLTLKVLSLLDNKIDNLKKKIC